MKSCKLIPTLTLASMALMAAALALPTQTHSQNRGTPPNSMDAPNGEGISRTLTTYPKFDLNNPFFQPLGINGRTCATCHPVSQGMAITPDYVYQVFAATQGLDPLFAPVDGANAPNADMSTPAARQANCSMLLTKGLIRVERPIPPNAEFSLLSVDDPYHYANANAISCFRRPLPSTNLRFLASVMWDGRELAGQHSIQDALASQARDAVLGHMQALTPPTPTQVAQIIDFETHLYTSQIYDNTAGRLNGPGISAGPASLIQTPFFAGINDAFDLAQNRQPFDPEVFALFEDWLPAPSHQSGSPTPAQQAVARGEKLFNTRQFVIRNVAGLNDLIGKASFKGTCSSCHSVPKVGSNGLALLMNTGIADGSRRTSDMPLYTLRNKKTGATVQTTDPGAALTSGKWGDIGKFKVPSLRGLETQSPYMHNGFSGDLLDILDFYDTRFQIGLTAQEKADLRAFLVTL
ncbi:MAG: di-heme enzyme family [Chthonomonadaceae bacterium]|nr:di-heme enzyme family [Chthonomonadaceae bacterium]